MAFVAFASKNHPHSLFGSFLPIVDLASHQMQPCLHAHFIDHKVGIRYNFAAGENSRFLASSARAEVAEWQT
ncbi:MAG: hypothetical protein HY662_03090, partial [Chloroflexi bacterium]|nr:hypothetical protein [Chloroflexota bacterium]